GRRPEARHPCAAGTGPHAGRPAPGHDAWPGLANDRVGPGTEAPALGWLATRAAAEGGGCVSLTNTPGRLFTPEHSCEAACWGQVSCWGCAWWGRGPGGCVGVSCSHPGGNGGLWAPRMAYL